MNRVDRNVNITIRDNRGPATLVGFVAVLVLSRLWWTGLLTEMCSAMYAPQGESLNSVSYTLVSFAANLIYGIGTVIVLAWSGLWWLIMDVIEGLRQWLRERQAKSDIVDSAVAESVQSESNTVPQGDTLNIVNALQTIDANIRTTHDQLQAVAARLDDIDARVTAVESQPKPRTTRAKSTR